MKQDASKCKEIFILGNTWAILLSWEFGGMLQGRSPLFGPPQGALVRHDLLHSLCEKSHLFIRSKSEVDHERQLQFRQEPFVVTNRGKPHNAINQVQGFCDSLLQLRWCEVQVAEEKSDSGNFGLGSSEQVRDVAPRIRGHRFHAKSDGAQPQTVGGEFLSQFQ